MMINSGVSEQEVLNSFENISLQPNENAPEASKWSQKGVEDLLGQPSGKFDCKVFYSKPPSYDIPIESIILGGQGDEFQDDGPISEEDQRVDQRVENSEQPQQGAEELSGQHLSKSDDEKKLDKKKACTVEVWKDEVIETVTKEM